MKSLIKMEETRKRKRERITWMRIRKSRRGRSWQ